MNDKLNKQWVRGSIFYDRELWGELLTKAIFPFIEKEKELIDVYYLHLEVSPRDHIKVTFKAIGLDNSILESLFLDYMDVYTLDNPSTAIHTQHNFYPNNTVWVNQYNESDFYLEEYEHEFDYIKGRIANTFKVLAADTIDMTSMFTLIFYLQLGLIRAYNYDINQVDRLIESISEQLKGQYKDPRKFINTTTYKIGKQFYSNNRMILADIINDIWGDLDINSDLGWLRDWITSCKDFIKDSDFIASFIVINRLIYDSLGLMNHKLFPLSLQILSSAFDERNIYQNNKQSITA